MNEFNTFNEFESSMTLYPSIPIRSIFDIPPQPNLTLRCNWGFRCGGYYDKKIIQLLKISELISEINKYHDIWYDEIINRMK